MRWRASTSATEDRYGAGEQIASVARRMISPAGTQNLLDAVDRVGSDRLRGIARVIGWLSGAGRAARADPTARAAHGSRASRRSAGAVRCGRRRLVDRAAPRRGSRHPAGRRRGARADWRSPGDRRAGRGADRSGSSRCLRPERWPTSATATRSKRSSACSVTPTPRSGKRSIAALNSIGHADMPARIIALLDDPDPIVRESAVRIAGYFGYPECLGRVLELLRRPVRGGPPRRGRPPAVLRRSRHHSRVWCMRSNSTRRWCGRPPPRRSPASTRTRRCRR